MILTKETTHRNSGLRHSIVMATQLVRNHNSGDPQKWKITAKNH